MMGFGLRQEDIQLPQGAWAAGERTWVCWNGQPVLGLTQGAFRPYVFPVHTPAGFAVTSESPADHPHHHSIWVGADHLNLHVPAGPRTEVYSYNFYVNDVFQGRAPGRIWQDHCEGQEVGDGLRVTQHLQWRGPREWGAPEGRHVLSETLAVAPRPGPHGHDWYISPWGVMTANPCLHTALSIEPGGAPLVLGAQFLVCDGKPQDDHIQQALSDWPSSHGRLRPFLLHRSKGQP